jgi:tetratricopeptide (TPR) repeat protein
MPGNKKKVVPSATFHRRDPPKTAADKTSRGRAWTVRVAAGVLLPLFFLLLLEAVLRLAGFGYSSSFFLPSTVEGRKVYIQNDRFTWRFFGRDLARQPTELAVPQVKVPGTVRIFVFGESAAYGDPKPEFGLPRMLEALLGARHPHTLFEVVNVAMTAINSHVILPIARDCARKNGDIWVIYMGNNEVVGPFGAGTVFGPKAPSLALIRTSLALKATRTGQLLERLATCLRPRPGGSEWGGMNMFVQNQVRQDDPRMAVVYANFRQNLQDILEAGCRKGAKIVVSTVGSNLKDCAPFGSMHPIGLTAAALKKWDSFYEDGVKAADAGRAGEAMEFFKQAEQIDDSFAELNFREGGCCLDLHEEAKALRHYALARDQDTLRFRCDSRINDIIRQAARGREEDGIAFVDGEEVLAQQSTHGLPGDGLFFEHVHLNFEGNYALALCLAQQVEKLLPTAVAGPANSTSPWPSEADCARRLAWTDLGRYEAESLVYERCIAPPFTAQFNHAQKVEILRHQIEQLLPAIRPTGLLETEARCRDALAIAPDDWVLQKNCADVQHRLGDLPGEVESWRRVVELRPQYTEAWEHLGELLLREGRDDAEAAFGQVMKLDTDSVNGMLGMARILSRRGLEQAAAGECERVLQIKPNWGPGHLEFGKFLRAHNKPDEARLHFDLALQDRESGPAWFDDLGLFCLERGQLERAVTNFEAALRIVPWDFATHLNLGVTFAKLGDHAQARRHYAEAARLDPDSAEAHFRLGFELDRGGDAVAATKEFTEAVRLNPDLPEPRLDLGMVLVKQHRENEALTQIKEALRLSPTNAIARQLIESLESANRR